MSQTITISKKTLNKEITQSFQLKVRGLIFQGFVVKKGDQFYAYQNLCKHLSVTLDLNDNNFLTYDKNQLQCHMHGAVYELDSGLCTAGPCEGKSLNRLELEEDGDTVVITVPDEFESK